MESEILEFLNSKIREEHGNRVTIESDWIDTGVDSYGTVMVTAELDNKYECFSKEWYRDVDWYTLTIKDVVDRIINESKVV